MINIKNKVNAMTFLYIKKLIWRLYSIIEILIIIKYMKLINWKKFAIFAFYLIKQAFVVYVVYL